MRQLPECRVVYQGLLAYHRQSSSSRRVVINQIVIIKLHATERRSGFNIHTIPKTQLTIITFESCWSIGYTDNCVESLEFTHCLWVVRLSTHTLKSMPVLIHLRSEVAENITDLCKRCHSPRLCVGTDCLDVRLLCNCLCAC